MIASVGNVHRETKGAEGGGGGLLMGSSLALAFSDIEMIPIQINHVSICL